MDHVKRVITCFKYKVHICIITLNIKTVQTNYEHSSDKKSRKMRFFDEKLDAKWTKVCIDTNLKEVLVHFMQ